MSGNVPPIPVGDRSVFDPVSAVSDYCGRHAATLHRYDWLAGTTESLSWDLVTATRQVNSRISKLEQRWLVDLAATAPWGTVDRTAPLRDADPVVCGGLYDATDLLYQHFVGDRPRGVNRTKISKCLDLMRPGLIPILDSRLTMLYRQTARTAARTLEMRCPGRPPVRRAYWAAVRHDLLRANDALTLLRDRMRGTASGVVPGAADRLSDERLLDIVGWSTAGQRHDVTCDHRRTPRQDNR